MVTEHAKKNIFGNSTKVTEINDKDFDIFIYTVGWESRFTEILNHISDSFKSEKNYILSFYSKDESGKNIAGYDVDLKDKFVAEIEARIGAKHEPIKSEYLDFEKFHEQINEIIFSELDIKRRPLKIGFDISSCPRYYFLYILGLCISKNYTNIISFFYSEGEYSDIVEDSSFYDFFSSYGVETKIIPYLGSVKKEGKVIFSFSLGFESNFIIDEITKWEPDYVAFLCANPGYTSRYEENVKNDLKRIVDFCEFTENMYIQREAEAGDAISAWKQLEDNSIALEDNVHIDLKDTYVVHYTTGTKPHCLAMSLNGLVTENTVVKYRIAKRYNRRDVKPNGIFWRYDITNLRVI